MELLQKMLEKLGMPRVLAIGGIFFGVLVFFAFMMFRASTPDMGLLFSNLDASDGAKILERLKMMNVPTEVRGDGDQIFVPVKNIAKLRMELASDGLPAGGTIGYEIFDKTDVLGTTNALMDINFLRAIEGELSKSIRTVQGVLLARIHLVVPKKELFSNEKQTPSASIIIKMKGNSRLSVNQVLSIQHLVASAVPNLTLDRISIIDDKGTLLAKGQDANATGESAFNQQEIRQTLENKMSCSIESLLERTVGAGKIRAEVNVDMDFDKVTSTSVEFNPDGQVARSQQSSSEGSNSNESSLSDAVSVQNTQPDANAGAPSTQSKNQDTRSEDNISYEISNTTKTYVHEAGAIKRLSIAVLLDGTFTTDKNGKNVYQPRTDKEIAQITDLVKTAVGFQEQRGDTVKVINMPFNEEPEAPNDTSEFMKMVKSIFTPKVIEILSIMGLALILFYTMIRPLIWSIMESAGIVVARKEPPPPALPAVQQEEVEEIPVEEEFINVEHIDGRMKTSSIKKIGEIIEKHPEETVSIIRSWMYS